MNSRPTHQPTAAADAFLAQVEDAMAAGFRDPTPTPAVGANRICEKTANPRHTAFAAFRFIDPED